MSYEAFDRVVIIGVGAALLASAGVTAYLGTLTAVSLSIQVLVAFVAVIACRYGRRGGSAAALLASILYVLVQGNASASSAVPSPSPLAMVWPIAAFGIVGIAGGQILTMLKYDAGRFTGANALDDWSRLYNERHFAELLSRACERYEDTRQPCCVILLRLSYSLTQDQRPSRHRHLVRMVAQQVVSSVRLVDDCARLDDGSFAVLLSACQSVRAAAVSDRLSAAVTRQLRGHDPVVSVSRIGLPDDAEGFKHLMQTLGAGAGYPAASTA